MMSIKKYCFKCGSLTSRYGASCDNCNYDPKVNFNAPVQNISNHISIGSYEVFDDSEEWDVHITHNSIYNDSGASFFMAILKLGGAMALGYFSVWALAILWVLVK